jgi:Glycosyltransferase family 87
MIDRASMARRPDDVSASRVKSAPEARANWGSIAIWGACAAGCLALCAYVISKAKYSGEDSWFPMSRALDFLHGSSSDLVYQKLFFSEHVKFQYPPTGLLALDLLRWLGIGTSAGFNAINAGLLIVTGLVFSAFSVQILGQIRFFSLRVPVGPIAFLAAIRFYPSNLAFQIGQMQILLGLLFLLACWASWHDRRALAGCLIALAATVKPQFFPLGLLALWRKNWSFVAGLAAVTAASLVLSISLYGWRTHLDYLDVLGFLSKHGEYQHLNQSVDGILVRWLYQGPSLDRDPSGLIPQSAFPPYIAGVYIPTILSSVLMLVIPFLVRAKANDRTSRLLEFCGASILFTMASPIAWVHHYNILLPIYVVALKAVFDRWQGIRAATVLTLLAASFVLTGYPLVPAGDPTMPSLNLLQSHVFFGALVLVGVLLVEMRAPLASSDLDHKVEPSGVADGQNIVAAGSAAN